VLLALTKGTSKITENLFENRFKHIEELKKLGAQICQREKSVTIKGVKQLAASHDDNNPTNLYAHDLRGGVALTIAALAAGGTCIVHNAQYINRGHGSIEKDLVLLGANIIRVDD